MTKSGDKKQLGRLGEKLAAAYLKQQRFRILTTNFKYHPLGEIDIIAQKTISFWKNTRKIHFIEVKATQATSNFRPVDNWSHRQQQRLLKLAKLYLWRHQLKHLPWQIDLITITFQLDKTGQYRPAIEHHQNVLEDIY